MKTNDLFGVLGNIERKKHRLNSDKNWYKDKNWYNKVVNSEPKKIYRECPNCGKRVGIPEIYPTQWCFMCGETIYRDLEKNEEAKKKYEFMRKMKGINENDKKTTRRKKVSKEIQHN